MAVTDLLGFAMVALVAYMVVTRFLPYFRSPRLSKRDRTILIRDAEQLLESGRLTPDERHNVLEALSTLRADASREGESWGGRLPVAEAAEAIRTARQRHAPSPPEQGSQGR